MVRDARFSKNDAGGFDIPDARDSFDDFDDAILDGFSSPKDNKSRKRRKLRDRKTKTAPPGERTEQRPSASADWPAVRPEQPPPARE